MFWSRNKTINVEIPLQQKLINPDYQILTEEDEKKERTSTVTDSNISKLELKDNTDINKSLSLNLELNLISSLESPKKDSYVVSMSPKGDLKKNLIYEPKKKKSLNRFMSIIRPQRNLLIISFILQIIQIFGELIGPLLIGIAIEIVNNNNIKEYHKPSIVSIACSISHYCSTSYEMLINVVVEYIVAALFTGLFTLLSSTSKRYVAGNVLTDLRCKLFDSLIYQDITLFDMSLSGGLVNRLSSDVTQIGDVLTMEITNRIGSLFLVIGCCIYISSISYILTCSLFVVFPIIGLLSKYYGNYFKKKSRETQDYLASASHIASEVFNNIRTVKSFSREDIHILRYHDRVNETRLIGYKMAWARGEYRGFVTVLDNVGMSVMLFLGGYLVVHNEMSISSFTTFILYSMKINSEMKNIIDLFSSLQTAIGATLRVFDYIEKKPIIKTNEGYCIKSHDEVKGYIELKNLSFYYPSRTDFYILKDFNLTIEPNTKTALVGISGSGKSTIMSLVMRFYDPIDGVILIDNKDLKDYNLTSLHNYIVMVSQEPILFACSIADNIAYGIRNHITMDDIINAAKSANAHSFITSFPDGYSTFVGERGIQLSGGQKQRIAIARALLMNPRILVLDEATSALDAESEHLVQQALDRLMEGRTVLLIAHRLSTVQSANNIVVLDQGKIIEQGTHQQLIEHNGFYSFLFKRQKLE